MVKGSVDFLGLVIWRQGMDHERTWKSAFSVPPFSALFACIIIMAAKQHTSENCVFHWLIYSIFHIFI